MPTDTVLSEENNRRLMRFLGFMGGLPLGIFTGIITGFIILKALNSQNTYDGLIVIYTGITFGVLSALIGIFIPKFILETLRSTVLLLVMMLLPAYLFFLVNIKNNESDIDTDKFIIKGNKQILDKLNINVRYFISANKKPLYTIYHQGKNRFGEYSNDYQYKNNIDAGKHEFFINYNDQLFSHFVVADLKKCSSSVLFNSITIQKVTNSDSCISENFLNFLQKGNDIYYGCQTLNDDHCTKLNPLQRLTSVPDVFTLGHPIGLAEIERNRNKRSFWMSLLR